MTGASSGIGTELARELAGRGLHVALCARRRDRLEALAREIEASHGRETLVIEADLGRHEDVIGIEAKLGARDVGLVANNAGFGDKGSFLEQSLDEHLRMVDTNCRAVLTLAHVFGRRLVARGRGGMIIASSTAAFQGLPFSSLYAATKGFDLQLAEGLWFELKAKGVDVVALCPGPTDTEGPKRTGVDPSKVPVAMMDAKTVARAGIEALGEASVVVPGLTNRLSTMLTRVVPRRFATSVAGRMILRVTGGN